jgi:putative Mn2+ efflux pump MntP
VLAGTTAGMLIADAIGIGIGIVMGKKIPERAVKWIAALIFIGFGFWGLYEYLPEDVLTAPVMVAGIAAVALAVYWLGRVDIGKLTGQKQAVDAGKRD